MEMFGLLFGMVWLFVATIVVVVRSFVKRNLKVGHAFRPYVICSCALGAIVAVAWTEFPTGHLGTVVGAWLFLWSPVSLVISFMTARRYCWLPFSYVFALGAYCMANVFLVDMEGGNGAMSCLGTLLGVAFLLASLYTYFDLQVNISSRVATAGAKAPWITRINSLSMLGGIMMVLLAIVGVTYGFLAR